MLLLFFTSFAPFFCLQGVGGLRARESCSEPPARERSAEAECAEVYRARFDRENEQRYAQHDALRICVPLMFSLYSTSSSSWRIRIFRGLHDYVFPSPCSSIRNGFARFIRGTWWFRRMTITFVAITCMITWPCFMLCLGRIAASSRSKAARQRAANAAATAAAAAEVQGRSKKGVFRECCVGCAGVNEIGLSIF